MITDLNQLSKICHQNAVDKGFYDPPQSDLMIRLLIVGELYEALEAHRKGKICFDTDYDSTIDDFKSFFEQQVKGTFEDELADVCIRIFDYCGYQNINIENPFLKIKLETLEGLLKFLTIEILKYNTDFKEIIYTLISYCMDNQINIFWHIDKKLEYNKTRPHKHGKRY